MLCVFMIPVHIIIKLKTLLTVRTELISSRASWHSTCHVNTRLTVTAIAFYVTVSGQVKTELATLFIGKMKLSGFYTCFN